ncbi:hypothetical protein FQR65_LT17693 [Abscondita terminalis]|nr:hypothetical protein FQR65_LT17693 [Abscondita terminalis]
MTTLAPKVYSKPRSSNKNKYGHFAEWTQRRNELLDTSPKLDIWAKFLIGHNAENGQTRPYGHNAATWTQRRNELLDAMSKIDTTSKSEIGAKTEKPGHFAECPQGRPCFG